MTDFTRLSSAVSGPVLTATDAAYAAELSGFNLSFSHSPDAVVGATDAADIVATVRYARDTNLPVRALATGHGDHAPIVDGLVVTTRRLDSVSIDATTGIATIGAGTVWSAVVAAAADLGFAPITGSASSVGAVGYLLGGGLGPLARSHGFSSDYVVGYTVVTGTGELVDASDIENPDLYWALRGGKGGLGIVTEVRLQLVSIPSLYAGSLLFPAPAIEPVLRAWVDFTQTAPDDVTTSVAIMRFPPIEEVPEPLRGQTLIALRFAYPGSVDDGQAILAPLRAVAPPIVDAVGPLDPRDIATIHNDPTEPGKASSTGALLDRIDQDFATALLGVAGADRSIPLVAIELRHIGGATHTDVPEGSAVGGRKANYTITAIGSLMQPGVEPAVEAATQAITAAVTPWISAETNINFAGLPHDEAHFASAWVPDTFARLAVVREKYDPNGIFPYGPAS
jgi:hypothetical protein